MALSRRGVLGVSGAVAAAILAWGPPQAPVRAQGGDVVVFAAASLKNALDAVNAQWQKETGKKATISYAASSALAKQIEQAAPGAGLHLGRSRLDGLSGAEEPDQAGDALQPARQPHRAGRAQGQGAAGRRSSRASILPRCWATAAWRWPTSMPFPPANTARRRWRSSASGPACRARWPGRERARGAAAGLARRGAGRHRLPDRRRRRSQRQDRRHLPGGHAPADHLPDRADGQRQPSGRRQAFLDYVKSAKAKPLFEEQGFSVLSHGQSLTVGRLLMPG